MKLAILILSHRKENLLKQDEQVVNCAGIKFLCSYNGTEDLHKHDLQHIELVYNGSIKDHKGRLLLLKARLDMLDYAKDYDIVCFQDDDAVFNEGWLQDILTVKSIFEQYECVVGITTFYNGTLYKPRALTYEEAIEMGVYSGLFIRNQTIELPTDLYGGNEDSLLCSYVWNKGVMLNVRLQNIVHYEHSEARPEFKGNIIDYMNKKILPNMQSMMRNVEFINKVKSNFTKEAQEC